MGPPSEQRKVRIDELHLHPDLTPKEDPTLTHLMQEAYEGRVPVYYAEVPLALCVPGDPDYRPDLHPAGEAAIFPAPTTCPSATCWTRRARPSCRPIDFSPDFAKPESI
jgi:hypothetical protein